MKTNETVQEQPIVPQKTNYYELLKVDKNEKLPEFKNVTETQSFRIQNDVDNTYYSVTAVVPKVLIQNGRISPREKMMGMIKEKSGQLLEVSTSMEPYTVKSITQYIVEGGGYKSLDSIQLEPDHYFINVGYQVFRGKNPIVQKSYMDGRLEWFDTELVQIKGMVMYHPVTAFEGHYPWGREVK
jgi:hypothetical protein